MAAESVVLHSESESRHHAAALRRPHGAVVGTGFLGKRSGFPALHPGSNHGNMIDAAALYRHIAADFLKTLAPENLARAGHMLDAHKAIVVGFLLRIEERRSNQPQRGVIGQFAQQEFKIAFVE